MHERKNSAVIGRKTRFMYVPNITFRAMGALEPITALHFSPYIIPRNFAKRRGVLTTRHSTAAAAAAARTYAVAVVGSTNPKTLRT